MAEILIVDDDRNFRETLREVLEGAGYGVRTAADGRAATAALQHTLPDLMLCDWRMPDGNGEELLRSLQSEGLLAAMPVLIMTAHGTGPTAVQAMQLGAYDFITKPLDMDRVLASVARAIRHMQLQREVDSLREQRFGDDPDLDAWGEKQDTSGTVLVGNSPAWIEVFKDIGKVARTDVGVLLLGESGTGKGVVARVIHENSERSRRSFTIINCATLPAELLESELFGHERGSFTGAVNQKIGKFEAAAGGTIFLDEIGELPLALQPKLLRVLQERTFERVGGTASLHADARVIAATNRPLEEDVANKSFRADLFYRLNGFTIHLPPLRDRRSDLLSLAEHFLRVYAQRNATAQPHLTDEAVRILEQHGFPGNVRELEHLMERLSVLTGGRAITAELLAAQLAAPQDSPIDAPNLKALLDLPFHESVALWERRVIAHALDCSGGNKSEAARRLGIHRRLLYEKLQQLRMV